MAGKAVAVIGYQFGDEGKGKIVDLLSSMPFFHASVRFNGGNNAGHTVVKGGKEFKLHIIPSSVVEGKPAIISHGCVVDPVSLEDELKSLGSSANLVLCENAHLIMPYHIQMDRDMGKKIGTTGRGIGPSYADKAYRLGFLAGDIIDREKFLRKAKELEGLRNMSSESISKYLETGSRIKSYVRNSFESICKLLEGGKNIILEGAQGTLLDIDAGNYPYVTSSHTTVAGAMSGTGLAKIDSVLGVVKAYITRVGNGPLPTELTDETGEKLRQQGKEFGTTTGRARRCGWLDIPLLKYAAKVNGIKGINALAITKLDVLNGLDKIKICTAYKINGRKTEMPFNARNLEAAEPVYEEMEGWNAGDEWDKIAKEGYDSLPKEAIEYLDRIEKLSGIPIFIVSIGPERSQTVFKREISGLVTA